VFILKRKLAFILSVVVALTMVFPLQAFAATIDKSLENAIKIAKSKFDIPSDYIFDSNIGTDGAKKVFYLNWSSRDTVNGGNVSVTVNEDGVILNYYSYSPDDYSQKKKLPALSRQDAVKKAEEYIRNIDPNLPGEIKLLNEPQNYGLESSYYFVYYREVNGLPFYSNNVYVSINNQTGKLLSFSRNWTFGLKFPTPEVITQDEAKQAYKDKMGLKLVYKYWYNYENNSLRIYPAYIPVYDNNTYVIDAETGERVNVGYYYGISYDIYAKGGTLSAVNGGSSSEVILDPDEQKAVADAAKLITLEKAEAIAKAAGFIGLTSEYKLENYSLYPNWPFRTEYTWNLNYVKTDPQSKATSSISVAVNANTGVITSYYTYTGDQQGNKPIYTEKDAKEAADNIINKYYADFKDQLKYDEQYSEQYEIYRTDNPLYYTVRYNRVVNGIEFPDNYIMFEYSAVTGKIYSLYMNWFNTEFPAVKNPLSLENAYAKLFENIGLNLEYRFKTATYSIYGTNTENNSEIILAYALDSRKPHTLDAFTGKILDYDGKEYKEYKGVKYTDIEGSYAKMQINVLAESGILPEVTEFRPKDVIVQKEFLSILSKTLNYYGVVITENSTQQEIDNLYAYLVREGIIKQDEIAPNAPVTREEGVKYIIRAMKFDKVADLRELYKESTFADRDQITPNLEPYVCLATGLKIINGYNKTFSPRAGLTREAAAVMIYNYLMVT